MTIQRKLEDGILFFLQQRAVTYRQLRRYAGHVGSHADDRKLPGYIVSASAGEECFPGGPPKLKLDIMLATQLDDNEEGELPSTRQRRRVRVRHDIVLGIIDEALNGATAVRDLQRLLNYGAPQKRPVTLFHLYDITKLDDRHAFQDRCFIDELSFEVIAESDDNAPAAHLTSDTTEFTADSALLTADAA